MLGSGCSRRDHWIKSAERKSSDLRSFVILTEKITGNSAFRDFAENFTQYSLNFNQIRGNNLLPFRVETCYNRVNGDFAPFCVSPKEPSAPCGGKDTGCSCQLSGFVVRTASAARAVFSARRQAKSIPNRECILRDFVWRQSGTVHFSISLQMKQLRADYTLKEGYYGSYQRSRC